MEQPEDDDDDDEDDDQMADDSSVEAANTGDAMDVDMTESTASSGSQAGSDSECERSSMQSSASTARTVPSVEGKPRSGPYDGAAAEQAMDDTMDIPSNDVILANKRAHPTFKRLFRSKGEYFLATRPRRAGDWSQAGAMLTMTGGRPWFCTLPEEEYTTGDAEVDSLVQHDIKKGGEWGDRRQELVFIGENLDHGTLEMLLDECLLTDDEMRRWVEVMRNDKLDDVARADVLQDVFDDGFPDWIEEGDHDHDHMDEDGHDHSHGDTKLRTIKQGKVVA